MKPIRIALPVFCALACGAQPTIIPSKEVTMKPIVREIRYCLGPIWFHPTPENGAPSDISLKVRYSMQYENHLKNPIIIPLTFSSFRRVEVVGQAGAHVSFHQGTLGLLEVFKRLSRPDERLEAIGPVFLVIPEGQSGEDGDNYLTVRLTSAMRLLGKTIEFSVLRDHDVIPSTFLDRELQPKWAQYGTFWTGTLESEPIRIAIPESPETSDCLKG